MDMSNEGNVGGQKTDEATKTDEAPKTVSLTAYQKLQRRNAELAAQLAASSINNSSARVEELLQEVVGLLGDEAKPVKEKFVQRRQTETQQATKFAKLNAMVENYDGDFESEPKFAEARAARDNGKLDEAIQLTEAAIKPTSNIDIDAIVDAKVTEKLKVLGKVDTGGTTGTNVKLDLTALANIDTRRMTPTQLKAHNDKLNAAYFQATGVKFEK